MCRPISALLPTPASVRTLAGRPMEEGPRQFSGKETRSHAREHGELYGVDSFPGLIGHAAVTVNRRQLYLQIRYYTEIVVSSNTSKHYENGPLFRDFCNFKKSLK